MSRSKKKKDELDPWLQDQPKTGPGSVSYEDVDRIDEGFRETLKTDPKYSLEIDPLHRYGFDSKTEDLIKWMVQYKNVQFVSTVLLNIPIEEGIEIYKRYDVQSEIKRLNMAVYARRFATKMADLDALGGYLTSGLIDENVPVADRWSPKDKLTATKLLMTLNSMKRKGYEDPVAVETIEVQKDLAKLSPNDLKQLIEFNEEEEGEKDRLVDLINADGLLSMEELKNLRAMSLEELTDLANTVTGGLEDGESDE